MIDETKELETRNKNILYLNKYEFSLQESLKAIKKKFNLDLPNITSIIINKNFQFETMFYSKELNYYYKSAIGNGIFLYLITINDNAMKELKKAMELESKRILNNSILSRSNKYLKKYCEMARDVENLNFDEYLIDKLYSLDMKKELKMCLFSIELELLKLKGIEYSNFCVKRIVDLIQNDTKSNNNKKNVKSKKLML